MTLFTKNIISTKLTQGKLTTFMPTNFIIQSIVSAHKRLSNLKKEKTYLTMVCSEFSLIHFHTTDSSCEVFKGIRGKNYSLPKARNPTGVEETPDLVTPSEPNLRYPWLKVVEKMEE